MPFAAGLRKSLQMRGSQVPTEFTRGDSLENVLNRHLMTVERMGGGDLYTCILLLGPDGKRLWSGAAPNLPQSFRDAIDGMEIGPCAGSCGTAAYLGRPVYVTDIETDPLWADYRLIAQQHGIRSCWSTPIREKAGSLIGTFAILHRTERSPTRDEIEAIDMITEHVAHAIMWARGVQDLEPPGIQSALEAPWLKLVSDHEPVPDMDWLLQKLRRLETLAVELDRHADTSDSEESRSALRAAAEDSRRLITVIRQQIERHRRLER